VAFDRSGTEDVPERLSELPAQPTVYATLGTVFNQQPRIFEAILAAFDGLPANLILTVGRNVDPAAFGAQPPNVIVERYIPQSEVLGRCDAVITHGGYNTLIAALRHGLPVCCLPMAADQPINTRRAVRLGTGLSCANARRSSSPFGVVDPERLQPAAIRDAVQRLLNEPGYRAAARRLRAEIEALPGTDRAVAALEQLVGATARSVVA
jgi:MGT family glycosyltransferase